MIPRSLFAALASGLLAAPGAALALTFLTESSPPNNYLDQGKLVGIATEVLQAAAARAELEPKFVLGEWSTVYIQAQADRDTCVFSTARLENRENIFTWLGPVAKSKWALYARAGFQGSVATLADAKKYRIGSVIADARGEYLMSEGVTQQSRVAKDEDNPARLTTDLKEPQKVDLWITDATTATARARAAKVSDLKLVLVVREQELWLACNPRTGAGTLKALGAALDAVNKDGTARKIAEKYEALFR